MSRGMDLEKHASECIHKMGTPILIHPHYLRLKGAGQIDIAILQKKGSEKIIKIFEVKSSRYPSARQLRRLKNSAQLLGAIFNVCTQLFLFRKEGRFPGNQINKNQHQGIVYKAMNLH